MVPTVSVRTLTSAQQCEHERRPVPAGQDTQPLNQKGIETIAK